MQRKREKHRCRTDYRTIVRPWRQVDVRSASFLFLLLFFVVNFISFLTLLDLQFNVISLLTAGRCSRVSISQTVIRCIQCKLNIIENHDSTYIFPFINVSHCHYSRLAYLSILVQFQLQTRHFCEHYLFGFFLLLLLFSKLNCDIGQSYIVINWDIVWSPLSLLMIYLLFIYLICRMVDGCAGEYRPRGP